ncbi:MAG: hypothetical protein JWO09_3294 [Bacteroidetes bacterium]|nr:hypothetical protein [Bacteroidota bacterium]
MLKNYLAIFFFLPTLLLAQRNFPLNREWGLNAEKAAGTSELVVSAPTLTEPPAVSTGLEFQPFLSSFKPYIVSPSHIEKDKSKNWFVRKIKKENLIIVNDTADKFYLTIDPLFNFEFGMDMADTTHEKLYKNTRGFIVRGDIGKKFSFESSFYENQATYAKYIDNYIAGTDKLFPQSANYNYDVVPGQGRSKAFKKNGYDYAMASGYISYSPNKIFNIQLGHGKHFVGDGYRSLLLSDNSFNYPYARITTTWKNIQYTNLYTSFMNLTDGGVKTPPHVERLFQKKTGSFQMLSVNLWKRLQLGLFQGMIFEAADSANKEHVNFNTFDPVIGVNTAVYGLHNKNNILLGATLKLKVTSSISLYGQYMLDDVSSAKSGEVGNKYGYQLGLKYFDLFTIKNLHLQLEYNSVRPYAYAADNTFQSYTHYNQALAHPLGANFNEVVGFINYRIKDFFIELKGNYAVKGNDSAAYNYGGNVFRSSAVFPVDQPLEGIKTAQGIKTTVMYEDVRIGYLVNPATNFNIVIGVSNRTEQALGKAHNTQFVYFGIRTSLANFYYDF